MKIKPVELVLSKFLYRVLSSPYCREYFRKNATGAQKSMPKINQGVVSSSLIPLPPLAEQKAIVAKVESLLARCEELSQQNIATQSHAAQLMQAVLKEAFQYNGQPTAGQGR
jgi:type I restriction enzyme S subunit